MRRGFNAVLPIILLAACADRDSITAPRDLRAASTPLAAVTVGSATALGTICNGEARGVNSAGQAVGWTGFGGCTHHAFRWSAAGGLQDLGTLGGSISRAFGINTAGNVVGEAAVLSGQMHAFLWQPGVGMTDIGTLGGVYGVGYDINDNGAVAGYSLNTSGFGRAFLWTASGGMQDLGELPDGNPSVALGINNVGKVVGFSGSKPFIWSAGTGMQPIPLPAGTSGQAWDINDAGQVVGYYNGSGFLHAFRWSAVDGFQDLGVLAGNISFAYGINNQGHVVGQTQAPDGQDHAFIWTENDGMVDLGLPFGNSRAVANDISDGGHVAGFVPSTAVVWNVTITVNEPPVVDVGGPYGGSEGSLIAVSLTAGDGDGDALALAWSFGDGTSGTGAPPSSHTYADNGTYTITLTADDGNGGVDTESTVAVIANVGPELGSVSGPLDPIEVGSSVTVNVPFSDAGTGDTHSASISWGDGVTTAAAVSEANGSGTASGVHTYLGAGVYTVTVNVTDDDAASGSGSFTYVVIFDSSAGFVTGGGWIDSPAGAYAADASLTGKATLGFVSKYSSGAQVPTGNTEFQFKVGGLTFRSTNYSWLVVAGARAQFKGVGTINGGGSYDFMVTAIDGASAGGGGVDRFRIKIWSGGGVVYDNQAGDTDNSDPTTALGGGSIVIHK